MTDPEFVIRILRQSLESGETVEIEGLGTFRKSRSRYQFEPQVHARVFIAYVAEDLSPARSLCDALRQRGFAPWLDKEELLPGQNWPRAIQRAIENSDVFVACFSTRAVIKRGQFQSELRFALDCARRLPLDSIFLIPVRLDDCAIPGGLSEHVQYVDLFPDWDRGINDLARAIRRASRDNRPIRPQLISAL